MPKKESAFVKQRQMSNLKMKSKRKVTDCAKYIPTEVVENTTKVIKSSVSKQYMYRK